MKFKQIQESRWFKLVTNIYVLVSAFFIIWMLFFDTNSFRILWSLESKIDDLERQKEEYISKIQDDSIIIEKLSDSTELEKFGRENYYLKKEDEDIYIIEFRDSIDSYF